MSILKIAYRNVARQKRRSRLLVGAIGFGVLVIVVINSLTAGLLANGQKNFTSLLGGHIYISGQELLDSDRVVNRINDTEVLEEVLPLIQDKVKGIYKRSVANGELIFGSRSTRISFSGVNWDREESLISSLDFAEGSSFLGTEIGQNLILPDNTAEKLGVILGETVLFRFEKVTGQKNVTEFTVGAIIKDTGSFGISSAYGDIDYFNPYLGLEQGEYQTLNIELNDITMMEEVSYLLKDAISALAPLEVEEDEEDGPRQTMMGFSMTETSDEEWEGTRFRVMTLNDYMETILQLVVILNYIAMGLFLILLTITMVGLLNTFRMILIERTREIGTMRAVGMLKKSVKLIFLLEALFLAIEGVVAGLAASLVVSLGLGIITFPDDNPLIFFLDKGHLSLPFLPLQILLVIVILLVITLVAAGVPAGKAAKLQPADALRSRA